MYPWFLAGNNFTVAASLTNPQERAFPSRNPTILIRAAVQDDPIQARPAAMALQQKQPLASSGQFGRSVQGRLLVRANAQLRQVDMLLSQLGILVRTGIFAGSLSGEVRSGNGCLSFTRISAFSFVLVYGCDNIKVGRPTIYDQVGVLQSSDLGCNLCIGPSMSRAPIYVIACHLDALSRRRELPRQGNTMRFLLIDVRKK